MATFIKKGGWSMLSVFALFLGMNISIAQEQAVKTVSAVNVINPALAISGTLRNAIIAAKADANKNASQEEEYVWFPALDDDCEGLDLTTHPAPNPTALPATQTIDNNPEGCLTTGNICCAKGYAMSDVEYDATNQRWIPKANPQSDVITVFRPEPVINK